MLESFTLTSQEDIPKVGSKRRRAEEQQKRGKRQRCGESETSEREVPSNTTSVLTQIFSPLYTDSDQSTVPECSTERSLLATDETLSPGVGWHIHRSSLEVEVEEAPELCGDVDPFTIIRNLPRPPKSWSRFQRILPRKRKNSPPITLVLDLDETLVHCGAQPLRGFDHRFSIEVDGESMDVWALVRPFARHFLEAVAGKYEIVLFTASQEAYAKAIVDLIDPHGIISHRLYRDSCLSVSGNLIKDLSALGRDLSKVIMVDNSPIAYAYHVSNAIPVVSWFGDRDDRELLNVLRTLEGLQMDEDVRPQLEREYGLSARVERAPQMSEQSLLEFVSCGSELSEEEECIEASDW